MKRFFAIFIARNLEFFRDKGTLIWNLLVPLFLIFGIAFAFNGKGTAFKVGTIGKSPEGSFFMHYKYVQFIPYTDHAIAVKKLSHHQIDMLLDFSRSKYYINQESQNGYLSEKLLEGDKILQLTRQTVTGEAIRYIDWFVPGVLGMNILFGCLMGVGFVIVRYRHNGVLKRFKATPIRSIEFISAQILSRFFIVALMSVVVYAGTNYFLHFQMRGSYLSLAAVLALAILCHISLGLLFASRFKSVEVANGIISLSTWPMMIFSGTFFSLEGTPKAMQYVSQAFPITHFLEASRQIMLDGASLSGVMDNVLILGGCTLVFLISSSLLFKWE